MLTLTNVNKIYADGTHALNNISLSLPTGMVGLLGPNGAGKSSLMRTLAGLQASDAGKIIFDGIDILQNPQDIRKVLGYLPQEFGVYPNMSCYALLKHIAILKGLSKPEYTKQIEELLILTNLTNDAGKKVSTFSGGMKQRFGIAQALLGDPKLIIMDEPTAGLDPAERERLNNLLVSISDNKLVLLSTHIVSDIENLCHHVALVNKGSVIDNGNVQCLIKPLDKKVWSTSELPNNKDFKNSHVLSKTFRFGKPTFRIYGQSKPSPDAHLVEASLQDRYFFELNKTGELCNI